MRVQIKHLMVGMTSIFSAGMAGAVDVNQELSIIGRPVNGEYGFQPSVTELARDVVWLDSALLYIITAISLVVLGLIGWIVIRYNRRRNPHPATFSHYTPVEILWTVIPVLILVVIGTLSLPILFKQQIIPEGDIHIKATGNQWYWNYEYPDHEFNFDSFMLARDQLEEFGYSQDEYLLATDTAMVVPVNKTVVINVTGADVIHSWTVPAFGVKQDGVPGRLAGLWFTPEVEGVFFGQCSELCGKDHAYMPITVKVVSQETYDEWISNATAEYAEVPTQTRKVIVAEGQDQQQKIQTAVSTARLQ